MQRPSGVDWSWTLSISLSVLLSACASDNTGQPHDLPPGAPAGLSGSPVLVVGERPDDPDHELYRVVMPFLLPDGGVGVPLASERSIRIFDEHGEFVRSLGSPGQGPGEFVDLGAAWAREDTIEALDYGLNRVTRFVPGEAPETIRLEDVASAQSGVPGLTDGSWVRFGVKEVQTSGRDLLAVHHFAPDGIHIGELAETFGFRRLVHDGGGGPDPISPRAVVRTDGTRVYVAETLTAKIDVFDVSTGATRSLEWEPGRALSHAEAVELAREPISEAGSQQMDEAWILASFRALTGSEQVPVFWDFLVDGDEFVWIRDYDPRIHGTNVGGLSTAGPGGEWTVLDWDGRHMATVDMPDDFAPIRIESDYLIGVRRDELDVESVRVYRIQRSGS